MMELLEQKKVSLQPDDIHAIQAIIKIETEYLSFNEFKISLSKEIKTFLEYKKVIFKLKDILPEKTKVGVSKNLKPAENEKTEIWLFNRITSFFNQKGCDELLKQLENAALNNSKNKIEQSEKTEISLKRENLANFYKQVNPPDPSTSETCIHTNTRKRQRLMYEVFC